jgi:hypothetical protein
MTTSKHFTDRRRALRAALVTTILLAAAGSARAADGSEGLAGDWLTRYASARSVGMGGATVAVADEPQAALWNPASVSWLAQNQLQVSTVRLFEDTSVNGLAFAKPSSRLPSFAFNLLHLKSGEFQRTDELNQDLGTFDEGNLAAALTISQALSPAWSVGANLKLVRQTIEDFSGSGLGVDLGVMGSLLPDLRVGASLLNVGGPTITLRDEDEAYPGELRGGAALTLLEGHGLVSVEAVHRADAGTQLRTGAEFRIQDLALRVGWFIDNVSAGLGYAFANGLQFDYGMSDHELGMTHRFGLTYRFGGFHADVQADPEIFSPTGLKPVTRFVLTSRTKADTRDWQLNIVDKSGNPVRSFGGQGNPPAHVLWDGKDETGLPLPDGRYRYTLTVHDAEGRINQGPERTVEISTSGPQGSVEVQ